MHIRNIYPPNFLGMIRVSVNLLQSKGEILDLNIHWLHFLGKFFRNLELVDNIIQLSEANYGKSKKFSLLNKSLEHIKQHNY